MQRARIDRRKAVELRDDLPAQFERRPFQQRERAADAAFGLRRRLADLGSSASRPSARAAPAATSATDSGRSISRRQRERIVGSSRAGAWLTSSSSAFLGGSSRIFSSALAPCGSCSSSAVSTMHTRQPPSPAVEPKNDTVLADVLDPDHGEELAGLLVDRRARAPAGRDAPARRCAAPPDGCPRPRATSPTCTSAPPDRDARARTAPSGRPASPCRCRPGRRSARHAACARSDRRRASSARPRRD